MLKRILRNIAKTRFTFGGKEGISILEVMISMVILAFGILGLAPMMVISLYSNSYSSEITTANALVQARMEQLKSATSFSPLPWYTQETQLYNIYTRETQVDDRTTDGTIPLGVYKIKVKISWTDQKSMARSINYYTYKMKG
jgi:Tfp pilus assembly protein PilV